MEAIPFRHHGSLESVALFRCTNGVLECRLGGRLWKKQAPERPVSLVLFLDYHCRQW